MIRNYRYIFLALAAAAAVAWSCVAIANPLDTWMGLTPMLAKGPTILIDSIIFAMFCIVMTFAIISKRATFRSIFGKVLTLFAWAFAVAAVAALAFYFTKFKAPSWMAIVCVALAAAGLVAVYLNGRTKAGRKSSSTAIRRSAVGSGQLKYCYSVLYASLFLIVLSDIGVFVGACLTSVAPVVFMSTAVVLLALILWRVTKWRGILLPAIAYALMSMLLEIYGFAKGQVDYSTALINGMSTVIISGALIIALSDLYLHKENNI